MKFLSRLALCAFVVTPLCGCNVAAKKAAEVVVERMEKAASMAASASIDSGYIATLTPLPSGDGLIVCAPVAQGTMKNQINWGTGAARWLQVQVGGAPELGKTPNWGTIDDVRRRQHAPNLQLSGAPALMLGRACGVSHVATATLSGTPENATLAYQLRDVASGKVTGNAQIRGSLAQLNAQLPALAKTLAVSLQAHNVSVNSNGLAPDELAFLGALPHKPRNGATISTAQQARLKNLVAKDVLAGILAQRWCEYRGAKAWQNVADSLAVRAPHNALVWAEIGFTGPMRIVTLKPKLSKLQAQFPNNYLLCKAGVELERGNTQRPLEVAWAEKAVRAAPNNSYAWNDLEDALGNAAQSVRRSRYSNQIGLSDWKKLDALYAKSEAVALQATRVDASDSFAWSGLARAATFNGDSQRAGAALEKALALDPSNGEAWSWGMQMTQPKWSGSTKKFLAFATRAANHSDVFYFPAEDVSHIYQELGQRPQFKTLLQTAMAKNPRNAEVLTELGAIYHYDERSYNKAEKLYRQALAQNPNYGRALSMLGDLTYWVHNDPAGAFELYRRAIAADPRDGYFHANLGRMLALTGRKSAGAAEAKIARDLGFRDTTHPVWEVTGVAPPGRW